MTIKKITMTIAVFILILFTAIGFAACEDKWEGGDEERFIVDGRFNTDGGVTALQNKAGVKLTKSNEATINLFGGGNEATESGIYSSGAAYINESIDKLEFELTVAMEDNDIMSWAIRTPAWFDEEQTNPIHLVVLVAKYDEEYYAFYGNTFSLNMTKEATAKAVSENGTQLPSEPTHIQYNFEKDEKDKYINWSAKVNGLPIVEHGTTQGGGSDIGTKNITELNTIWLNITTVDVIVQHMHIYTAQQ